VVGVEIPLSEIEDKFFDTLDEGVYAYLINLDDGTAAIHPKAPRSFEQKDR